jgi:hypothetical protein
LLALGRAAGLLAAHHSFEKESPAAVAKVAHQDEGDHLAGVADESLERPEEAIERLMLQQKRITQAAHDMNETLLNKVDALEKIVDHLLKENERISAAASGMQMSLQTKTVDLAQTIGHLTETFGGQPSNNAETLEGEREMLRRTLATTREEQRLLDEVAEHDRLTDAPSSIVKIRNRFAALAADDDD